MIQQLHIDIKTKDGISKDLYDKICKVIREEGFEVMDDAQAPYTEDMTYAYAEFSEFTEIEDYPKVNHKDTTCSGTCLQGYIDISYDELVNKLGESGETDGYKTDAEWLLEFNDGTVATIYNYKSGKNYDRHDGLEVDEIRDWHIGGRDKKAVEKVYELFEVEMAD